MAEYANTCLAVGGFKEAILYFKHVVVLRSVPFISAIDDMALDLLTTLPPQEDRDLIGKLWELYEAENKEYEWKTRFFAHKSYQRIIESEGDPGIRSQKIEEEILRANRFAKLPVFYETQKTLLDNANCDVFLTISQIHLVNLEDTPSEQLIAFREDEEAQKRLRSFRLFAFDNYKGKSKAYIEDDIGQRIEDYHATAKKHGFLMRNSTMSFLLKYKTVKAGLAGSFIAPFLLSPAETLAAIGATATAIGIDALKLSVELSKQKFELAEALRENPVSFVIEAKAKLETKPK